MRIADSARLPVVQTLQPEFFAEPAFELLPLPFELIEDPLVLSRNGTLEAQFHPCVNGGGNMYRRGGAKIQRREAYMRDRLAMTWP